VVNRLSGLFPHG